MARKNGIWFSFAGIESGEMGVRVAALPDIPAAEARGRLVEIPGRDGAVWLDDQAFRNVAIQVEIELTQYARLGDVTAWLSGPGPLVLSTMPDFCYDARVTKGFELRSGQFAGGRYRGKVEFTCKPFRTLAQPAALSPFTEAGTFAGRGSWFSRPAITVYGSGDIVLTVNDADVMLSGVSDHITLDCDAMMAMKDGVNVSPQVTMLSEGQIWPTLLPEGRTLNRIGWTGDVSRVVIEPRWRWR